MRKHATPTTTDQPVHTVSAGALLFAPQSGGEGKPVSDPAPALTTKVTPFLVTYNRTGQARPVSEPSTTVTTKDRHALVEPAAAVQDCGYRGVQPHEQGRFMAFPDSYRVTGTKAERTKLYGNAVTPPAMTVQVERVAAALGAA